MQEQILQWLAGGASFWAYAALGGAAFMEYVFPPFPGDAVTLFGVFLTVTAGYRAPIVFAVVTLGSIVGCFAAYAFGRSLAGSERHRRPWFLRGPRAGRALDVIAGRFARHGPAYLVVNRFVPALRALVFVAAGIARIPAWQVLVYGGVSAIAWNALIFGAGWTAGRSWERLQEMSSRYTIGALVVLGVVALVLIGRAVVRRARGVERPDSPDDPVARDGGEPPAPDAR